MSTTRSPDGNKAPQSPPPSPLKMSEIKPEFFAKTVRKHAGRAKERILQNLGKADRTTDEVFDDYVHNFSRQQGQATRLQKEMSNYVRCARAMQAANKSMMDTIYDMYEPEWSDRERLERQARELELLWADYCHKLSDQVLEPLNTYASQFPEVRRKVEKRGRKLVDYDSHRHNYEALQNNTKKRDQAKITKQHEVLEEARRTFELMNNELYDELPALYDSRIPFLVSNMQTLFMAEHNFQSEAAKVQLELEAVMDELQKDSSTGKYTTRRNAPKSPKSPTAPTPASPTDHAGPPDSVTAITSSVSDGGADRNSGEASSPNSPVTGDASEPAKAEAPPKPPRTPEAGEEAPAPPSAPPEPAAAATAGGDTAPIAEPEPSVVSGIYPSLPSVPEVDSTSDSPAAAAVDSPADGAGSIDRNKPNKEDPRPYEEISYKKENGDSNGEVPSGAARPVNGGAKVRPEELYDIPVGATTENLPPGVLYRVKAAYKYQAEDADELSFEVAEIIQVVEYEDAEEQEEGWLMGVKETSGQKGLFPANFTRPI
ncbi:myc box-dependent-interacting protein 1-like isoform X2 [Pollicipes pollicipes]|uniref:myc box-dependent-interacting protein 1-like isoform X2 n=1 Tax=Pollicipes pollicipes TaxID=41117 RepID=UPI0018851DED|nr:myc box-dependent-interacting protein 1-like isoform X2 [Pollicipes pollicipes]